MNKTMFATIAAILLVIFLLKDWSGCTEPTKLVNLDSLEAEHAEALIAKDVQLTALQWEIRDLNMARRWDSVMLMKQDKALKGSNIKLKQAIAAYEAEKTLENCDTVIVIASDLSGKVDSLSELIPQYQQTIDELVTVYDEALNAANDKALQQSKFYEQMRDAAAKCQDQYNGSIKSEKRKRKTIIAIAAGVVITSLLIK